MRSGLKQHLIVCLLAVCISSSAAQSASTTMSEPVAPSAALPVDRRRSRSPERQEEGEEPEQAPAQKKQRVDPTNEHATSNDAAAAGASTAVAPASALAAVPDALSVESSQMHPRSIYRANTPVSNEQQWLGCPSGQATCSHDACLMTAEFPRAGEAVSRFQTVVSRALLC